MRMMIFIRREFAKFFDDMNLRALCQLVSEKRNALLDGLGILQLGDQLVNRVDLDARSTRRWLFNLESL